MAYAHNALDSLTEAVALLASSEGSLADRLRAAECHLAHISPAEMDAHHWGRLVRIRGTMGRANCAAAEQRASLGLVDLLVQHASQHHQ